MSKAALLEKLTDKTYRDAFVSDEIDVGLPMQLRYMREAQGWKQKDVAEKTGTKQSRFSLMEKPGYGKFSLNTLKRLASLFDVGLIVSFVPFSEMIDFTEAFSNRRLMIAPFAREYARLANKYERSRSVAADTGQVMFDFATKTDVPYASGSSTAASTSLPDAGTPLETINAPIPYFTAHVETGTYART